MTRQRGTAVSESATGTHVPGARGVGAPVADEDLDANAASRLPGVRTMSTYGDRHRDGNGLVIVQSA